jgi:hypothetical protein
MPFPELVSFCVFPPPALSSPPTHFMYILYILAIVTSAAVLLQSDFSKRSSRSKLHLLLAPRRASCGHEAELKYRVKEPIVSSSPQNVLCVVFFHFMYRKTVSLIPIPLKMLSTNCFS